MRQGDNGPRAPDLRGAGAALSGTDAPTGVASHQDGHLEEGPRLCDLGTTVDSNTVRQAARGVVRTWTTAALSLERGRPANLAEHLGRSPLATHEGGT